MSTYQRSGNVETFCNDLARLYQTFRIYPASNEHVRSAARRAAETLRQMGAPVRISRLGEDVVVEERVLKEVPKGFGRFLENFPALRWESVRFGPEIGEEGLLRVMAHVVGQTPGPFSVRGFTAGILLIDGEERGRPLLNEGAGYLQLVPLIQELLADLRDSRRGAWLRARDVVRTLSEFMLSGEDLFGPIRELKDYDEYTFTHALNVSLLSAAMARTMQAESFIIDAIAMGGLCHDLGKQSIPMEVLRKPGKLDEAERAIMDRHPVDGAARILLVPGNCPPLVPVIAFEHHMHTSGGGYPRLPVPHTPHPASLLTAVADTYDAVRTVRPYQRRAFSPADALSILIGEIGKGHLHRVFVSVFARLINVVTPGRWVRLSDGSRAQVVAVGEYDALHPLVETEERELLDLSLPNSPGLAAVEEEPPAAP